MSKKELSRRDFLIRSGALGAVALGSTAILSACGGGQEQAEAPAAMEEPAMEAEPMMAEAGCSDLSGLAESDVQMRQTLQYVEASADPEKMCSNCQLYVAPEGDAACGGCQIIKGPIAPGGFCTSWSPQQM